MTIYDAPVRTLSGDPASLADHKGKALLIVNVASQCGLTPQYTGLEQLSEQYGPRGFEVLGFPCNQFGGQEPGTSEEIAQFCSTSYGVRGADEGTGLAAVDVGRGAARRHAGSSREVGGYALGCTMSSGRTAASNSSPLR